jgi:hypothetical protein
MKVLELHISQLYKLNAEEKFNNFTCFVEDITWCGG